MQNSVSEMKVSRRKFRLFSWRTLGYCLVGLGGLATAIALLYAEEDWRGKHQWEKYKRAAAARGVDFDFYKFIPAPVPDDQNFAMTPFFASLFDYNPLPLKPGQTRWRDYNGYQRTLTFSTNFNRTISFVPWKSSLVSGHFTDFDALAATNSKIRKLTGPVPTGTAAAQRVLGMMEEFRPLLDEIATASKRPYARYNIFYDEENPSQILLPHLSVLKQLANLLQIRASAELAVGQTDKALEDVKLIFYLVQSLRGESFLISQLVRIAMFQFTLQTVWEGLAAGQWNNSQLRELQNEFAKLDLPSDSRRSLEAERVFFGGRMFDYLRKNPSEVLKSSSDSGLSDSANPFSITPTGWLYMEQVSYNRAFDERIIPGWNPQNGQFYPQQMDKNFISFSNYNILAEIMDHKIMANMLLPALGKTYQKTGWAQTAVNEALVACALERYRLANGKLPENLELLAPQYLERIPLDVCNGKPLIYHPGQGRDFVLYSVGWNEIDDGGVTVMTNPKSTNPSPDPRQGDWVWPKYSEK